MGRYITREYKSHNHYLKGSPIFIDKSRILYDTESLNILLQINLENVSDKDVINTKLLATYYYKNGEVFKQDVLIEIKEKIKSNSVCSIPDPIIIENDEVYSVELILDRVEYIDHEKWINKKKEIGTEIKTAEQISTNTYLYQTWQYYNDEEIPITYYPVFTKDYWICSCGKFNDGNKEICSKCNNDIKVIKDYFDEDNFEKRKEKYKKEISDIKEKQEQEARIKHEANVKSFKKGLKIFIITLVIFIILIISFLFIKNLINYQKAEKHYNKQEYYEAIEILIDLKGNKAKDLLNKTYYDYGIYLQNEKDYKSAINYFKKADNKNSKEQIKKCSHEYALQLTKKEEYEEAIKYFKKAGLTNENDEIKNCLYGIGIEYYNNKDYYLAIEKFKQVEGFKDSNEWISKTKLSYINNNLDINNSTTREYFNDLKAINYSNVNEIYKNLTKWTTKIYANNSSTSTSEKTSLPKYGSIYYHIELSGGEYQEEIKLRYRVFYSDGSKSDLDEFDNKFEDGSSGYVYWLYGDFGGPKGNTTVVFYNGSNNNQELGRLTINIY